MTTPDIGLSFIKWLDKSRKDLLGRLFFCQKSLNKIAIWDTGENGGFYHLYENQHEKYSYDTNHEYPASHNNYLQYFCEDNLPLDRPTQYNFTNARKEYPLKGTSKIFKCPTCRGSGKVKCSSCRGTGKISQTHSKGQSQKVTCFNCWGTGKQTCGRCSGEGKLLSYNSKDYIWKHTKDKEPIVLPTINRLKVRALITKTYNQGGSYPIEEFSKSEVLQATNVYNESLESLIQYSCNYAQTKEKEIKERFGTLLFQKRQRFYIPLGFINVLVNRKFGQFFVAGNLTYRKSNSPPRHWSVFKFLGWSALGIGISLGISLAQGYIFLKVDTLIIVMVVLGILMTLGVIRFILDGQLKWPHRWFIADDDGLGSWLLAHLLVQTLSHNRHGKMRDLCYTELFHPPQPNTDKSRHSFFCTIEMGKDNNKKITELFLASQRAITLFQDDLKAILKSSDILVWIIKDSNPKKIDSQITNLLQGMIPKTLEKKSLILIANSEILELSINQFPETQKYLHSSQIYCYCCPLSKGFDKLQEGKLPLEIESTLNEIIKKLK